MKDSLRIFTATGNRNELTALVRLIEAAPGFIVAAAVADEMGLIDLIDKEKPDLVLMDLDYFGDDPVGKIRDIMRLYPVPIVLMSSEQKAVKAIDGIAAGALTVIKRPPTTDLKTNAPAGQALLRTLKTYAGVQVIRHIHGGEVKKRARVCDDKGAAGLVVIASSTGGPNSLKIILSELPANLPAGIVVAQHITQGFTQGLIEWLDRVTALNVKLAEDGEEIMPGTVYFAPDEYHISIKKGCLINLEKASATEGHRPSCNTLLHSAAVACGDSTVGVILSGMGDDGAKGLLDIKKAGGMTIAQDEATCVVFGMPRVALENGAVDGTTPLASIAGEILRCLQ